MKFSLLLSLMPLVALAAPAQDSTEVASRSPLVARQLVLPNVPILTPRTIPVDLQTLVSLNPQIKDPNYIYPGDLIRLPATTAYVVRPGDTLGRISNKFVRSSAAGVTAETKISYLELATLNGITNPDVIVPGQKIFLPENTAYIVRKWDTLSRIAHRLVTATAQNL